MLRPLVALLGVLVLIPTASATHQWTVVFHDDFDGTSLNPAVWAADPHTASIVVSGGAVTLTGDPYFPFIETLANPEPLFPAGETFRATIDFQYLTYNTHGTGIWTGPLGLWQDVHGIGGTRYSLWTGSVDKPADLARHVVVYEFDGATSTLTLDGAPQFSVPGGSWPDYNLGFGNPTGCCTYNWNNLRVYSVTVERLTAHTAEPVPELGTLLLAAFGLVGVAAVTLRRR